MKYTSTEHPDRYLLDATLQRLGDFLTELNDSIELSAQIVRGDEPKLKRCAAFSTCSVKSVKIDAIHVHVFLSSSFRRKTRFPSFRRSNTTEVADLSSLSVSTK